MILWGLILVSLMPVVAGAMIKKALRITDKEMVERLSQLEEGQKALKWMLGLFIPISLVILGLCCASSGRCKKGR